MAPRRPGKNLELTITSLHEFGYGVGQKAGQTITVARTAVGDHVVTGPPHSHDKWTSADLVKVLVPGPDRVASPCRAFADGCGGCQWLHLSYPAQLLWKEKNLAALLRSRAGYKGKIHPLVPMARPEAYRNKLSLKNVGGRWVFVPEAEGLALSPSQCLVQTLPLQKAWAHLQTQAVAPFVEQMHLRSNEAGQIGVHVFVKDSAPGLAAALQTMLAGCAGVVGVGATNRQGYKLLQGEAALLQRIGDTTWTIPHNGFFQTNEVQAAALLDLVVLEARATKTDRVLDLYCGAGFFGLALAPHAREVLGIEENVQSVQAAQAGAVQSGIRNARFLAGDMGAVLAGVEKGPAEIAIVDPPREGLLPRALAAVVARAPQRIVYISCYPQSLVRDFKSLVAAGWRGVSCTPVDMFPHTSHVETVLTLER